MMPAIERFVADRLTLVSELEVLEADGYLYDYYLETPLLLDVGDACLTDGSRIYVQYVDRQFCRVAGGRRPRCVRRGRPGGDLPGGG